MSTNFFLPASVAAQKRLSVASPPIQPGLQRRVSVLPLLLPLLLVVLTAWAQAQLVFTTNNGSLTITGCTNSSSGFGVTIPGTISGLPVVSIGDSAFSNKFSLTGVTIPGGVTNIANGAFYGCSSLQSAAIPSSIINIGNSAFQFCRGLKGITFGGTNLLNIGSNAFFQCTSLSGIATPAGLQNIGDGAFSGCGSLGFVTFPGNSLTNIGNNAFSGCYKPTGLTFPMSLLCIGDGAFSGWSGLTIIGLPINLTSLGAGAFSFCDKLMDVGVIPSATTNIGPGPFMGCGKLTSIFVNSGNPAFSSVGGVVFDKHQSTLFQYPNGNSGSPSTAYTVPGAVTSIGASAFAYCSTLQNVIMPNTVTNIGDSAFESGNLTNVALPNSVVAIGDSAFSGCLSVTHFTLGNSVANIGSYALSGCGFPNLAIPDSVTFIGDHAFAFSSLTNITMGGGVASMGSELFEQCTALANITVSPNNPDFSGVSGVLFDKNQTSLIQYPAGISAQNYAIPAGVANIGPNAFEYCHNLTRVAIPNSVTGIGTNAFYDCVNLAEIYFLGNAPSGDSTIFSGLDAEDSLTVIYLPGATGWGSTFAGSPTALWNPQAQLTDGAFGTGTNGFGFNIAGSTNLMVVVEASADLANPAWIPISTNTLAGGASYLSDPQWTNYPARFYRLRLP